MFYAYGKENGLQHTRIAGWNQRKKSGDNPVELQDQPALTDDIEYLWLEYGLIRLGCDNMTFGDIANYMSITGAEFSAWEIMLLLQIDAVRRANG